MWAQAEIQWVEKWVDWKKIKMSESQSFENLDKNGKKIDRVIKENKDNKDFYDNTDWKEWASKERMVEGTQRGK